MSKDNPALIRVVLPEGVGLRICGQAPGQYGVLDWAAAAELRDWLSQTLAEQASSPQFPAAASPQ